jgi:transcriptional regulator with XRE-family HTH domain
LQGLDAEKVKNWRHRRMLSQQEVADRAGTSLFTVQRIERGEGNVRPKTGRGLAAALDVPIEELLPKAQASLFRELPEQEPSEERRLLDYHKCREALDRFCDYGEQALDNDHLDRRACDDFHRWAELAAGLLIELWNAEKVELRIQRGEDPQTIDESEPWPPVLMEKSELWAAIDRWMVIVTRVDRIAKERFGEDAAPGAGVADLREYARRRAS